MLPLALLLLVVVPLAMTLGFVSEGRTRSALATTLSGPALLALFWIVLRILEASGEFSGSPFPVLFVGSYGAIISAVVWLVCAGLGWAIGDQVRGNRSQRADDVD